MGWQQLATSQPPTKFWPNLGVFPWDSTPTPPRPSTPNPHTGHGGSPSCSCGGWLQVSAWPSCTTHENYTCNTMHTTLFGVDFPGNMSLTPRDWKLLASIMPKVQPHQSQLKCMGPMRQGNDRQWLVGPKKKKKNHPIGFQKSYFDVDRFA